MFSKLIEPADSPVPFPFQFFQFSPSIETNLGAPGNMGHEDLSREQGTYQKLKRNEGTSGLSKEHSHFRSSQCYEAGLEN